MSLVIDINQYEDKYIYFCEPTKNTIVNNSVFIRLLYTTNYMTLNAIYLFFTINDIACEKHHYKYKYSFNINKNIKTIEKIRDIEKSILDKYTIDNKIPCYDIYTFFKNGYIKNFNQSDYFKNYENINIILKISGIWVTNDQYGLAYKIEHIKNI